MFEQTLKIPVEITFKYDIRAMWWGEVKLRGTLEEIEKLKTYENLYNLIIPKVKESLSKPETVTKLTMNKYISDNEPQEITKGYTSCFMTRYHRK